MKNMHPLFKLSLLNVINFNVTFNTNMFRRINIMLIKNMHFLAKLILLYVIGFVVIPQAYALSEADPDQVLRQNTFGGHRETVEDMRVKVQGGFIRHSRSWNSGKWYFNRRWETLSEKLKDSTSTAESNITIYRGTTKYEYKSSGIYAHETKPSQIIIKTDIGYRWQNRKGDWIAYDENRRAINYGDRNNITVSFQYDAQDRLTGVFDHYNKQIFWYEYNLDGLLSQVRDYSNRKVEYKYTDGQLTEVVDVRGNSSTYTYLNDQLISKTDAAGRETIITYTASGLVNAINNGGITVAVVTDYDKTKAVFVRTEKYSSGKVITKWYDRAGNFIRKSINGVNTKNLEINGLTRTNTDQAGNRTISTYDQWDNLLSTTYPDGSKTSTVYEHTFTMPVKEVNENGVINLKEYDDRGNLTKLTEAAGLPEQRITSFTYDAYGNQLSKTIHADSVSVEVTTSATYDEFGNQLTTTDGELHVTEYTFDVLGNVLTRTDPLKHVWTYTYDEAGNQLSEKNPLNHETKYGYDKMGNLTSVTDALQRVTRYEYDARNNRVAEINALNEKTVFKYNGEDKVVQITDGGGRSRYIAYNLDGLPVENKDGNGNVVRYEYIKGAVNGSGKVGVIIYPTYREAITYDSRGRVIEMVEYVDENKVLATKYGYDIGGNLTIVTDAEDRYKRKFYDVYNRLVKEIDHTDGSTNYSYDNRNNLIAVTNSNNGITKYVYNHNNIKIKEIKPLGQEMQYFYNAAGWQVREIDFNNHKRVLIYNEAGQNTKIESYVLSSDSNPEKVMSYVYNEVGNLIGYNDTVTSASYIYDELNRLVNTAVDFGAFSKAFSYTYDLSGNKSSFTRADGVPVSYAYNKNNRITSIVIPDVGQMNIDNYNWNKPQRIGLPGGVSQNYSYDNLMRITDIVLNDPAQNTLMKYHYDYNNVDNVVQKQTEHGLYQYSYDGLDRLTTVDNPVILDEAYSYDSLGNRLSDTLTTGAWEYNLNNELIKKGVSVAYTYDDNGSLVSMTDDVKYRNYKYDSDNRLVEVLENGFSVAKYYYDPFGRRLSKQMNNKIIYYLYADEGLIAEIDHDGTILRQYGWLPDNEWGADPVYYFENSKTYFYINDHLGSPQKMINSSGMVVWSAVYDGFGKAVIQVENVVNNLRLPGQYFDQENGLHYNYFRDYDPSTGRYIESDPVGLDGGVNTYVYASVNPINSVDAYGLKTTGTCDAFTMAMQYQYEKDLNALRLKYEIKLGKADRQLAKDDKKCADKNASCMNSDCPNPSKCESNYDTCRQKSWAKYESKFKTIDNWYSSGLDYLDRAYKLRSATCL
ncbi:MAG: RHS domain-containing protein [Candidatus Pacearchaeota archaeon]|nr:RHS domain-containing protein [Candidatus Pacearchaeota archaeon]